MLTKTANSAYSANKYIWRMEWMQMQMGRSGLIVTNARNG